MRSRADAATAGPWLVGDGGAWSHLYNPSVTTNGSAADVSADEWVAECGPVEVRGKQDAEHIASWHPAVALAVADWLEQEADDLDSDPEADTYEEHDLVPCIQRALAVARAYLGNPT
jgi:hypothetical protein